MTSTEAIVLVFIFGFIFFMKTIIIYHIFKDKKNKNKNRIIRKHHTVLCVPSGEIIKIKAKRWNWLCKNSRVQWNDKYNYYIISDKYSKFKI